MADANIELELAEPKAESKVEEAKETPKARKSSMFSCFGGGDVDLEHKRSLCVQVEPRPTVEETVTSGEEMYGVYRCGWKPDTVSAVLTLLHGFGEHISRYNTGLIEELNKAGVAVYGLDLKGHGRSGGKAGYVDGLASLVPDVLTTLKWAQEQCPGVPRILMGHSMGGALAGLVALDHPDCVDLLIMSSATVKIADDLSPAVQKVVGCVSACLPGLGMVPTDPKNLSHDEQVQKAFVTDPLVYHKQCPARSCMAVLSGEELVGARAAEIKMPLLLMHGGEDKICDPKGSTNFLEKATVSDKTLYSYSTLRHEILNEHSPEKEKVWKDLMDWIKAHCK